MAENYWLCVELSGGDETRSPSDSGGFVVVAKVPKPQVLYLWAPAGALPTAGATHRLPSCWMLCTAQGGAACWDSACGMPQWSKAAAVLGM